MIRYINEQVIPAMSEHRMRGLKKLCFSAVAVGLALLVIEGCSRLVLRADWIRYGAASPPIAERSHTQHDPELGWVNVPGITVEDMYGPGISLSINQQGFRNKQDIDLAVQEGKLRIICSGDSMTLGYGVDDDHTWVEQLGACDSRFEESPLMRRGRNQRVT